MSHFIYDANDSEVQACLINELSMLISERLVEEGTGTHIEMSDITLAIANKYGNPEYILEVSSFIDIEQNKKIIRMLNRKLKNKP